MEGSDETGVTARRKFLAQLIAASVAFLAAVLGIPAVGAAVGPALKREETDWVSLGSVDSFQVGVPKAVNVTDVQRDGWIETTTIKGVWVVRQSADAFAVFNGRCTHLGCAYSWQNGQHQFACPCHAGVFAIEGKVLAGPPPRPLDTLDTRIVAGDLQAQMQDFRLGTPDKVAV
jgi:quinol---cytochrome c reductase iron-sulfur subunit, bacillus type